MNTICNGSNVQNGTIDDCLSELLLRVEILEAQNDDDSQARLSFFLMFSAFNIFLMQVGFAMLEVGTVQTKNAKSVLFKNIIDCCVGAIIWWIWGYGFSAGLYGDFIFYHSAKSWDTEKMMYFFHSYTFSTTCATIISGGVVERMAFPAYMVISSIMIGFIYPFVVSWVWTDAGWLSELGYTDFAGASVVHGLGGVATLVSCLHLGARIGRFHFDEENQKWTVQKFNQHSAIFANLGTFIIFFGWLSFNGSSTLGASEKDFKVSLRAVTNTLLSGASACVFGSWYSRRFEGVHNLDRMHNSLLIGLVSITGCCAYVDFYAAFLIGVLAAVFYSMVSFIMLHFRVDDPLDVVAVHGAGGVWGSIATGLFVNPRFRAKGQLAGLFFGGGKLLLVQILGITVIFAWGGILLAVIIAILKKLSSMKKFPSIRAHKDAELLGLDFAYYDGFQFPDLCKAAVAAHNEKKAAKQRAMMRQQNKAFMAQQKKVMDVSQNSNSTRSGWSDRLDSLKGLRNPSTLNNSPKQASIRSQFFSNDCKTDEEEKVNKKDLGLKMNTKQIDDIENAILSQFSPTKKMAANKSAVNHADAVCSSSESNSVKTF